MSKTTTKAKTKTKATTKRAIVRKRKPTAKNAPKAEVVALPVRKGSVVPVFYKAKAGKSGVLRADDLGTAIADAFLGAASPRVACDALLRENGLDVGRWEGKNAGMLRMNVTNVLRGARRNGNTILVRGKKFQPE